MKNTYWNNNGKHQVLVEKFLDMFPREGKSGTLHGEIARAASRVYYDAYNNGFSNDTSRYAQFLMNNVGLSQEVTSMMLLYCGPNSYYHDRRLTEWTKILLEQMMDAAIVHVTTKTANEPYDEDCGKTLIASVFKEADWD